ncbi:MAG: cache domain-containing protein [Proteobacteria bacterium]|nr:cache domain-containing protein [Pseudomonadota bacterium]
MKRVLKTVCAVVLSMGVLCLPAFAQSDKAESVSAQDMLIKSEVETAVSMLQAVFLKYQKGEISLEQARKLGADLLRELRYGVDGYFWADTTEGVNVVLYGRKDTEGRKRIEDKDQKGIFYVKEFLATGTTGGGYVEYWFPKKGETKAQAKRSYVLLFKPFGWVIGTGYYQK